MRAVIRGFAMSAILCLVSSTALAQGPIPGLTSTMITFAGHGPAVAGPDGNVWIAEEGYGSIDRLAVDGSTHTLFPLATASSGFTSIIVGPDSNLWFTELFTSNVGRITTSGTIAEFPLPPDFPLFYGGYVPGDGTIASGPDGNLWVSGKSQMAKVTPQGAVTIVALSPPAETFLLEIGQCVAGSDANLWCVSYAGITGKGYAYDIARITTAGAVALYATSGRPFGIVEGPDSNAWYIFESGLARITPAGVTTEYRTPKSFNSGGIAVGADGNIWFTEEDATGSADIWQFVLSTATFNTALIPSTDSLRIVAVPATASGSCAPAAAFYVFTIGAFPQNVPQIYWCKLESTSTCTDLVVGGSLFGRYFFSDSVPGTKFGFAECLDTPSSHDPAIDVLMRIQLPPGSRIDKTDVAPLSPDSWSDCKIEGSGDSVPLIQCTVPSIAQAHMRSVRFFGVFQPGTGSVTCTSSTPESNAKDNSESMSSNVLSTLSKPPVSVPKRR